MSICSGAFNHPIRQGIITILAMFVAVGCLAQDTNISLEKRAQGIDKSLMCPVCPSETVDQSQVELAKQMRVIIREKLSAGESRDEILTFFVARYGENVLAAPTKRGFSLLAWVVPVIGVSIGCAVLFMTLQAMKRKPEISRPMDASSSHSTELDPYLSMVDEELRL
ncbi:cytochrome c-type biogenesis protein CcmH [Dehalococcoidia bacterium]|nr:cytochrome c-type biogenesis protein CcmH [Dehalococcoidia bacterium]